MKNKKQGSIAVLPIDFDESHCSVAPTYPVRPLSAGSQSGTASAAATSPTSSVTTTRSFERGRSLHEKLSSPDRKSSLRDMSPDEARRLYDAKIQAAVQVCNKI